jgi:superoxide dismutase
MMSGLEIISTTLMEKRPMTNVNTNGQTRKTLASQLDRLDTILDTLDQGLQEAVASAVQEAVSVAVHEAIQSLLKEVLTNPEVLSQVRALLIAPTITKQVPQSTTSSSELKAAVRERFGNLWRSIKARIQSAKQACGNGWLRINQWTSKLLLRCRVFSQFKRQLLCSMGVGLLAGVGAYFAGPYVAAAAGWLSGFATTIGVQLAVAWKRLKASALES